MLKVNNPVPPGSAVREQERKRSSSAAWAGGQCICPKCSYKLPRVAGQLCNQRVCPRCGARMAAALFVF